VRVGLRTYSHLADARRVPSEYDVATSGLLYYPGKGGFEVQTPLAEWYRTYQQGSPLRCRDWERFRDPRETTYTRYTALQRAKEQHVDALLRDAEAEDHAMDPAWRALLARAFAPQRFLFHGLQMIAAYVGQMAPSGRIVIAAAFEAADQVRRVQRVAYRTAQLRKIDPRYGADDRELWQGDPAWQPLRRALERLLVAYDWGEALVGLNLCFKPAVDALLGVELGRLARQRGDFVLAQMLASFEEDAAWQRAWTAALLRMALDDQPENVGPVRAWAQRWSGEAREAVTAAAALLGDAAERSRESALTAADGFVTEVVGP
jgi:toluene monooxygenase system protein E